MGKLEQIYLAKAKRQAVERVDTATLEAGKGLVGDRYHKLAETHRPEDCRCWRTMSAW